MLWRSRLFDGFNQTPELGENEMGCKEGIIRTVQWSIVQQDMKILLRKFINVLEKTSEAVSKHPAPYK